MSDIMNNDFRIRYGTAEQLQELIANPSYIEPGCWYLCTYLENGVPKADLYMGASLDGARSLVRINGDISGNSTTTDIVSISKTEINDNGELIVYYSDNTNANLGKVIGKDGLTTSIRIGDNTYEHVEGVILLPDLVTSEDIDKKIEAIEIPDGSGFITNDDLESKGYITEHQDLSSYAKTETINKVFTTQKYEVLPLDGMVVSYRDNEIRVNTQHVDIASLPTQNAGDNSSDSYYYATFRAYAPEGATSVIEGSSGKMDVEHSELAIDSYGRKYTTIWPAIASKSGDKWNRFGDTSTLDKYLGFYYNFHWYKNNELISMEKVRVILTNDSCHDDLVPDAVARRIDDKIKSINIPETDLTGYATEVFVATKIAEAQLSGGDINLDNYATKDDIKDFISEVPEEYITEDELSAKGFLQVLILSY